MHGREILDTLLREHLALRERLREWEVALAQLSGSSYHQCQNAIRVLRDLYRLAQHELWRHFREEETILYPAVEHKLPRLRGLLGEFQQEHDHFRQVFGEFHHELVHFNATGELRHLSRLGRELLSILQRHIDREEHELWPRVRQEFSEEDWSELRRLSIESEVA